MHTFSPHCITLCAQVPQYVGRGKPKGHALDHLPQYLEKYGPFRSFWCFPFEAFLQVLKRLFEMSNYKTAPFTAARLWAAKHSLNLLNTVRSEWFEDDVTASSELVRITLPELQGSASPLLRMCAHPAHISSYTALSAFRFLSALTRGPIDIKVNSWVLISLAGASYVGHLSEMAQLVVGSASVVRMRLTSCRAVDMSAHDPDTVCAPASSAVLHTMKSAKAHAMLVRLEACSIIGMSWEDRGDFFEYRYVW